jgi:hypothetical protein
MLSFTTHRGAQSWTLDLTIGGLERAKGAGVDLLDGKTLGDVVGEPLAAGAALWALVAHHAAGRNIDRAAFLDGLTPEEFVAARLALLEALLDFFRRAALDSMEARLNQMRRIESEWTAKIIAAAGGGSSTSLPASSASTPPA